MRLQPVLLFAMALVATGPALAQFKVVGPDGKVTYTDRPVPPPPGGQVQPLRAAVAAAAAARAPLPLELRGVAERFPVTLYTSPDCPPCDSGRNLLQQRGIPFSERVVSSDDDTAALQRITNGRTVPSLTVGGQALRGFLDTDWQATLDLAGYPKESKLPRGWSAGPATPLVARAPAPEATAQPARPQVEPSTRREPAPAAGGIRF
ncbi:MAG: glutaredoxin family protein [Burkholderiaceae bacterium]|nr:glutaredoxin family protein [Burkholderiaceae bacterium]